MVIQTALLPREIPPGNYPCVRTGNVHVYLIPQIKVTRKICGLIDKQKYVRDGRYFKKTLVKTDLLYFQIVWNHLTAQRNGYTQSEGNISIEEYQLQIRLQICVCWQLSHNSVWRTLRDGCYILSALHYAHNNQYKIVHCCPLRQ